MSEFNLTCNKLAKAFNKDARTIKKKIDAAKLNPVDKTSNGYPVYELADVAMLIFSSAELTSTYDVNTLPPKALKEHYQAGREKLKLETEERELIKYDEAAEKYANLARTFSKFFDTFIDDMEQTQLFTVEQLEQMQTLCDDQRTMFVNSEF